MRIAVAEAHAVGRMGFKGAGNAKGKKKKNPTRTPSRDDPVASSTQILHYQAASRSLTSVRLDGFDARW